MNKGVGQLLSIYTEILLVKHSTNFQILLLQNIYYQGF